MSYPIHGQRAGALRKPRSGSVHVREDTVLNRIGWVQVFVSDMDRAVDFYENSLGP